MKTVTYSLRNNETNSDEYYTDISLFTDSVLSEADKMFLPLVRDYMNYLGHTDKETLRSRNEYMYEFLSIGIYWRTYGLQAQRLNPFAGRTLIKLYNLRKKHRSIKKYIDPLRGFLSTLFLTSKDKRDSNSNTAGLVIHLTKLESLFTWLEATGEFKEEVKRFRMWQEYFISCRRDEADDYLKKSVCFAAWFEIKGDLLLSSYTQNVKTFHDNELSRHMWTEDFIFCARKTVEYHLGMFGAEVMNRAFSFEFRQTTQKAVLLPACMRFHNDDKCKARKKSLDLICTGCTRDCRINEYSKLGRQHGFEVHIIPHSSDFTKWLKTFKGNKNIGVVGVACILNLITGGLEMKGLDIAAQCVLLDYCGCKNHWDKDGIATDINSDELLRILEIKNETLALAV